MPPPPSLYNASFTPSGGSAHGFDVRTSGYGWRSEANSTIRVIPWAQAASIVVQSSGQKPWTRRYRALFYTENDFKVMMTHVSAIGTLVTPREPALLVHFDFCERDDMQAPLNAALSLDSGELTAVLQFTAVA